MDHIYVQAIKVFFQQIKQNGESSSDIYTYTFDIFITGSFGSHVSR